MRTQIVNGHRTVGLILLILVSCSAVSTHADLITTIGGGCGGGSAFTSNPWDPMYYAFGNYAVPEFEYFNLIFDNYSFTTSDIGSTFVLTAADDPDFTPLVTLMTDGLSNRVGYVMAWTPIGPDYGGNADYESVVFAGSPFMTNGIDLQGTVIDSFALHINDLNLDSPGSDPNGQGNWTDFRFSVTLEVYGHVIPEPSTFVMLCGGAVICAACSFTKKRKAPTSASTLRFCRGGKNDGEA